MLKVSFCRQRRDGSRKRRDGSGQKMKEDERGRDGSKLKSAPDRQLSWNSCAIPTTSSRDR
jgi:hypothetical protein